MSRQKTPSVEIDSFAFQVEVEHTSKRPWTQAALAKLIAQLDLGRTAGTREDLGRGGEPRTGKFLVGLEVKGLKKHARLGRGLVVSGAAFDPETREVVGWTLDLDPMLAFPEPAVVYVIDLARLEQGEYVPFEIDKGVLARLGPPAKRAPVSADSFATRFTHRGGEVAAVAISPDGAYVVSTGTDRYLRTWTATGEPIAAVKPKGRRLAEALSLGPDGRSFVTGGGKLHAYSVPDAKPLLELAGHPRGRIVEVRHSPSGQWLASLSAAWGEDLSVALWDARTGERLAITHLDFEGTHLAFDPSERAIFVHGVASDGSSRLERRDLPTFRVTASRSFPRAERTVAICWAGDALLAMAEAERTYSLDPTTLETRSTLPWPVFVASPDGGVVLAWKGEWVTVRSRSDGKVLATWTTDTQPRCAAFSPSGKVLLLGAGPSVTLWSPTTGNRVA